ncbi:MAG: helicase C-terminal domain-containing protein [Candidatus Nanoarchaeia archaeon]
MWSLFHKEKELKPLVFSNGKSQLDVVNEVLEAVNQGHKIIFIRGMCGTGKSAIALNLARKLGKTSIVVPIKSLQEQYIKDYSQDKYLLKENQKLKICSIVGRQNFDCLYLKENSLDFEQIKKERNANLFESLSFGKSPVKKDSSCNNSYLPCKIELKEKNLSIIKEYLKQNPDVNLRDFDSIKDVRRMSIAPVCPYWSPIYLDSLELKKFQESDKIKYTGLEGNSFTIYKRKPGCRYYEQYSAYKDADVLIFNSLKYKIESWMNRKPLTELEVIDECDDFLDSFSNEEQISINKFLYAITSLNCDSEDKLVQDELTDIANSIKSNSLYKQAKQEDIFDLDNTNIKKLFDILLKNSHLIDLSEEEDSSYISHVFEVALLFRDFFKESFFSVENRENDMILRIVTTNLAKRFEELIHKNKIIVMMSGTIHSENVLKNIFGLEKFKIIDAETKQPGTLIKCKNGYEMDCKYQNFLSQKITREKYLLALSKSVACAKKPLLVHVNSFSDLPSEREKNMFGLYNLPTQNDLIYAQEKDPLGERVKDFKNKKIDTLFTTKCNRGIDFPGEICNSIIITRFPYPNVSSTFWKILKKTKPQYYNEFYMDKARRELLQKVYRGLRSKEDKVYLISPDIRVLDFNFENY